MFNSANSVIITNIQNQQLIQTNLDDIIDRHKLYRVNSSHVDNFTNAMTKAVTEIISNSDPIVKTWLKAIYSALE